jgi:CRISPR/Cas system-associated exonuclease Cas4 (RecB family)
MQPILETLAIHLAASAPESLGSTRIILPNRRAGLFLQRHLAMHMEKTTWAPQIYAISDFIDVSSQLERSDPLDLFFTLYDVYAETVERPDTLDEFYLWGEMMIRDFDELDKYVVDADMLFRNIIDLKALEEPMAGLEPEQIAFIRQFWSGFHAGENTPEKEKFLKNWEMLPVLYNKLRNHLLSRKQGYQGMQYREIVDRIGRDEMEQDHEGPTIVAGFNALNQCEKQIFSWLKQHGAEFYWDHDHEYTDNDSMEAGRFLRENMKNFPAAVQLEDFRGLSEDREIRVFELPTDVLQTKTVHRILEEKAPEALRDCTDTALVLCDEELLLPVMMSLPGSAGEINVTMGYPMKNTPVYSFIDTLLRMQHNIRKASSGEVSFYHRDVLSILLHPYFRKMKESASVDMASEITKNNMIMVSSKLFTEELEKAIFRPVDDTNGMINYLKTLFKLILETLSGKPEQLQNALDREFILQLMTHLNTLESLTLSRPAISSGVLESLLRKMLAGLRIPFEGEPLSGLQVMGILETRLLDFKHVILLSMNEEIMPASHAAQSNIPYSLRLAFGMPAREDMDAIYAYYFYRLLQRAGRVDLIFNGGTEGMRTGEMSRYLHQLIFKHEIEVIRPGLEVQAREVEALVVQHSQEISEKLERYLATEEEGPYLSPSAVNTYIDCSLKYYLRYMAGIGEADEIREEIDPAGFGTVVHDTLKELYSEIADHSQGVLSREELSALMDTKKHEEVLRTTFIHYHFKGRKKNTLEGRNIIIFRVMLRYLEKIIRTDMSLAPFELVSAEDDFRRNLEIVTGDQPRQIRMGGKIDRIDRVNGLLRVIDYKTGHTDQKFSTLESLFEGNQRNRNNAAMQTLFYAWLVGESMKGEAVMPGLYAMKGLFEENFDPALHMSSLKKEGRVGSFLPLEEPFLDLLRQTLQNLFDPAVPFVQRENDQKCSYCDFSSLCQRKSID